MDDSADMFGHSGPARDDDAPGPASDAAPGPGPTAPGPTATAGAAPAIATTSSGQPYRVLARKYRPRTFAELIGQEPMVQTLANAIRRGRLAHAFLMTGVRGVGKTSTARLIAKALNCVGPDGSGGPTIDPCGVCEPCVAIAEGRHIDVIEMDAASHTGVDDVREIIEAVRYAAVSARFKIYIIDEVHMLSRNAFNALLKTLEEPPAHVKFLFATTEVDKLPVTVLSRCQRFDLRRIAAPQLAAHFAWVCAQEAVAAEPEALATIAAAAEGSVRDGLSILDQAIAHADLAAGGDGDDQGGEGEAGGMVTAAQVREMLGLADKGVARAMLASLLAGDGAAVLAATDAQYALGVEPLALLRGVMALVNRVTVAQVSGAGVEDAAAIEAVSAEEREALAGWARALAPGQLHRLWQLLLKGHEEVKSAPEPLAAAQMALLRVLHAADLPDPGELARRLEAQVAAAAALQGSSQASGPASAQSGVGATAAHPAAPAPDWAALVDRVEACPGAGAGIGMADTMRLQVRVVELAAGLLRYAQPPGFNQDLAPGLRAALSLATGERWRVERVDSGGAPTLTEAAEEARAGRAEAMRRTPLVAAALAAFPDAEFVTDPTRAADRMAATPARQQRGRA